MSDGELDGGRLGGGGLDGGGLDGGGLNGGGVGGGGPNGGGMGGGISTNIAVGYYSSATPGLNASISPTQCPGCGLTPMGAPTHVYLMKTFV